MEPQDEFTKLQFSKLIKSELFKIGFPEILSVQTNFDEIDWNNEHDVVVEIFVPKDFYFEKLNELGKLTIYHRRIRKRFQELAKYVGIQIPIFYPRVTYV